MSSPRETLNELGLGAYAEAILATEAPSIHLFIKGDGGEIGESRLGGQPDLPASVLWPLTDEGEAMEFALQINLAELPRSGHNLPERGMLYVFVGLLEPATDVAHRIILHTGEEDLRRTSGPENVPAVDAFFGEIRSCRLGFAAAPDFPRWATSDQQALAEEMLDDEADAYNEDFMWSLEPETTGPMIGKLFGHASGIGSDPREDAYVVREVNPDWLYNWQERGKLDMKKAAVWRHFLTIDSCSDIDLTIWDAGYLQFLVHEKDLAALDFSRAYAAVESS